MNEKDNPLRQFYRTEKLWVELPSNGAFYNEDVLTLNDSNEIGIMAMTAADEILFNNPDALLSGDAIKKTILSCVPDVNTPEELLSNDIDALIVAIRHASYGDTLDVISDCPKCGEENTFCLSIEATLTTSDKLEEAYPINLSSGVTAFVRPHTFLDNIKTMAKAFEQNKIMSKVDNPSFDDKTKFKMLGESIDTLSKLNFELISNCILNINMDNANEDEIINVTNKTHIRDFIKNISRSDIQKIQSEIDKINNIGIRKVYDAQCIKCEHEWEVPIDFNPATFFTDSLQ